MIIWITVKAGHSSGDFFSQPPQVQGSERAWLWLSTMTSITGGFSNTFVQNHCSSVRRRRCCRGQGDLRRDPVVSVGHHHEVAR
jgi:hypothetical protein